MKEKTKKYTFIVLSRLSLIILMVGIFAIAPTTFLIAENNEERFSKEFIGEKAQYQGIITLWNVDTFEGGSGSRSGFLEWVAMKFEKKFKGALIKIENLSIDEMKANLMRGIYPSMFSFGMGIAGFLKDKMQTLPEKLSNIVPTNLYSAGLTGGLFKAAAWTYGGYSLISTTEKIEKANQCAIDDLGSLAFLLSYDKTFKKSKQHVYSLTFGKSEYVSALDAFSRCFENTSLVDEVNKNIIDDKYNKQSYYDAYNSFIKGKSSMLLGTQRDIFRMENRLKSGVEHDVIYYPIGEYTDLIQFISIVTDNLKIKSVCENFICFLLSEGVQKSLNNIGMLSVNYDIYQTGPMNNLEKILNNKTVIKSAFA